MRHAGRESGIERVDVDGEVDRRLKVEVERQVPAATRFDDLDTEALELRSMMVGHAAKSDLNQSIGESLLHDPSERRGVRTWVALVGVIDVGVSVDVEDRQLRVEAADDAHDRMGDRVVAAQADQRPAGFERSSDAPIDDVPGIDPLLELDVAVI